MLCNKLLLFLLFVPAILSAQPQTFMERGNDYYQKQQYDKAVQAYNKVLNEGYESAELYYNLGNAYYRKGNLGYAILNYERALKLSPGDDDIRHNLALANSRTIDRINTLPDFFIFQWWESFLALLTFFRLGVPFLYFLYSLNRNYYFLLLHPTVLIIRD